MQSVFCEPAPWQEVAGPIDGRAPARKKRIVLNRYPSGLGASMSVVPAMGVVSSAQQPSGVDERHF
jgi:hypothetical protein